MLQRHRTQPPAERWPGDAASFSGKLASEGSALPSPSIKSDCGPWAPGCEQPPCSKESLEAAEENASSETLQLGLPR